MPHRVSAVNNREAMTTLTPQEDEVQQAAILFAKKNKKALAKALTDLTVFPSEDDPVSVFMAGSPGAGKTEASIALLERLKDQNNLQALRIDPDELRCRFPDYAGANSYLFQGAVSILVEKIHDLALVQQQSFLLDGTFSNLERAVRNIERSLKKKRTVQILYVYQEPLLAWQFVQAREAAEGRKIPREQFIKQYFAARDVVNRVKVLFKGNIHVDLLLKNNDNSNRLYTAGVDQIDNHIPEKYDHPALERMLKDSSG